MVPESNDFYVEKGKFVWTEKFLLNRGYCCNNNCRHCPYKKLSGNIQKPTIHTTNESQKETFWLSLIID